MSVLVEVPLDDDAVLLVEADLADVPHKAGLTLATPAPGKAVATAARSLSDSLEQLEPVLRTLKDKMLAAAPDHCTAEFGVKVGGETGVILAKGTAEANFKITLTWDPGA